MQRNLAEVKRIIRTAYCIDALFFMYTCIAACCSIPLPLRCAADSTYEVMEGNPQLTFICRDSPVEAYLQFVVPRKRVLLVFHILTDSLFHFANLSHWLWCFHCHYEYIHTNDCIFFHHHEIISYLIQIGLKNFYLLFTYLLFTNF